LISLTGVSKWYFNQTRVLEQVSLELKKGDFLYVLGGTGAGKSSLLRLLATEEGPSSGAISMFGYNLATASDSTLRAIRRAIGYVPQDTRLIPDLTVYDNVALSVSLASGALSAQARGKIGELLERVGLTKDRDKLCKTLSGGQAQRVAVARALARTPELIIADEPTGAQDRDSTWSLMDLFLKANLGGCAVVLATHDREIVRRVRKRCAVLSNGRLALEEQLCIY
jgi:cell division transport system ATP-binding protein